MTSNTQDSVYVANQGSVIQSSFNKVTHCELNLRLHPGESRSSSPRHEKKGDMRSFLHVKLSVCHWSLWL